MENSPVIEVFRMTYSPLSTQGLLAIDGTNRFSTLEPPKQSGMLMPVGTYHVKKTMSPHMGYISPELQDVPGHVGERIHIGNSPLDTKGCVLVGYTHAENWIGQSKAAFDALMDLLPEEFDLTIHDRGEEIA